MADSVRELKENCPPAVQQGHRPRHFCGSSKPLRESNTGDMPVVKSAASKYEGGQSYQQAKRVEKEDKENRPRKPSGRKTRQKTKQSNLDFEIFDNYTQMSAPFMQSNNIKKMKVPQRPISKTSDYVPKPANHDFMPASRDHMIKLQGPLPRSLQGSPESQLSNWTERNRGTCTSGYHSDTDTEAIATSSQVDDCNVATEVMVTASNFTVSQSGTDTETVVTNKMDSYHRNTFKRAITTDRKACCQGDATMATKRTNSHCSSGDIHDSSNNIQHLSPLSNISSTMFVCHRSPSGHPVQSNVSEQASVDYRGSTRASGRSTFGCRLSRGQQTAKTSHINSDTHSASGYKTSDVGSAGDSVTLYCQSDNTLTTKELETPYTAAPYCENEMNEAEKVQHWLNVSSFQTELNCYLTPVLAICPREAGCTVIGGL
ncbi:uncharacterized protein LOC106151247 [Lingula anatina]|uniref:Uncharacterized protein LOC106151247 n=1 Tax=Lingula anatina TaxID=7574 RepID=A0A1S3H1G2_LINAN|nr:uncharacterized protein LOC106151247 [Lingula anatina]|eukprot:XP_013379848.1 uncharacterized protein LOC106151247 [Lingula anatina]